VEQKPRCARPEGSNYTPVRGGYIVQHTVANCWRGPDARARSPNCASDFRCAPALRPGAYQLPASTITRVYVEHPTQAGAARVNRGDPGGEWFLTTGEERSAVPADNIYGVDIDPRPWR